MKNPCGSCPLSGCGAWHDQCPEYQKYKDECKKANDKRIREQASRKLYTTDREFMNTLHGSVFSKVIGKNHKK